MYGQGPAPGVALDAMLCQQFGCLPSQLDNEDGARLLNIVYVRDTAQAFQRLRQGKPTPADNELVGPILREEARRAQ